MSDKLTDAEIADGITILDIIERDSACGMWSTMDAGKFTDALDYCRRSFRELQAERQRVKQLRSMLVATDDGQLDYAALRGRLLGAERGAACMPGLVQRVAELEATIERFPKTEDGVPITIQPWPSCEVCDSGGIAAEDCPVCGPKVALWYKAEIGKLRATVERLPKTADGVPVVPGMDTVWIVWSEGAKQTPCTWRLMHLRGHICYSTREAAEAGGDQC